MVSVIRLPPPAPFPSDADIVPMLNISLAKLKAGDHTESTKLFDASKTDGFFLLDLQNVPEGEALLDDTDKLLAMSEEIFALEFSEKGKYALK